MLRKAILPFLIICRLVWGFPYYLLTRRTPQGAYVSIIQLFCFTRGYGLDFISFLICFFKNLFRTNKIISLEGVDQRACISDSRGVDFVVAQIRNNGFCVLDKAIDSDTLNAIMRFAESVPGEVRGLGNLSIYERNRPLGVRYDLLPKDILASSIFNPLLSSDFPAEVARRYLGCRPWLDVVSLWWHTDFSKYADPDAAQLYHFDLDRIKWLKVFIYITDVGPENGPHCFIKGSHKSGVLPRQFLRSVYSRLSDQHVFTFFDKNLEEKFIGPRGTVVIEDTRGLHKGEHVVKGDRLIFQMQYSNSLFGMNYDRIGSEKINPELLASLEKMRLKCAYV